MAVIATRRPCHQDQPVPIASATAASATFVVSCGRAASSTPKKYRKLASVATSMPTPATTMPERAVTGEDIRLRP
jgi:hypothetical protein